MTTKVSDERLSELADGWDQSRLAHEMDEHDIEFNNNCVDTANALRELQEKRALVSDCELLVAELLRLLETCTTSEYAGYRMADARALLARVRGET